MAKTIKIKQVPDTFAISTGLSKYNRSRMPLCTDTYQVAQGYDGRYLTGIDEDSREIQSIKDPELKAQTKAEIKKLRESLEEATGYDLSARSPFWETFIIQLSTDTDEVLNMDIAIDVIKHRALVANALVAPSFQESGEPRYVNAKYYCFVEEAFEEEEISTQKIKDKARSYLLEMSNNDDKMALIGQYLEGFKYKKGMKSNTLYSMLSKYINDVQEGRANAEKFIRASETSVEDLQYKITVDKAVKTRVIKFKDGQYFRGGVNLGRTLPEVLATLKLPEYANEFIAIHEEVV